MNNTYKELRTLAKQHGLKFTVMPSKALLKKTLKEKGILNENFSIEKKEEINQTSNQNKEIKPEKEQNKIPESLQKLGLQARQFKNLDEMELNYIGSYKAKVRLPEHVEKKIEAEGFRICYPKGSNISLLQSLIDRGYIFIYDEDGKEYKFDSEECNGQGERIYHYAMKREKSLDNIERKNFIKQTQERIKQKENIEKDTLSGLKLKFE